MLFVVCCDRGAPGATTTALALASSRGRPAIVVEADPYGGDLSLRLRTGGDPLPSTPTVLSLAAGAATTADGSGRRVIDLSQDGSHRLSQLVRVTPGFMSAEQGTALGDWRGVAAALQAQPSPVFADLGRIHSSSPTIPIAAAADVVIPVCRATQDSVLHLIDRVERLVPVLAEQAGRPPAVVPVVVANHRTGRTHARQVAELLSTSPAGVAVRDVGWIAWDSRAVAMLENSGDPQGKALTSSHLMKSARKTWEILGDVTGLDHGAPAGQRRAARRPGKPGAPVGSQNGYLPGKRAQQWSD